MLEIYPEKIILLFEYVGNIENMLKNAGFENIRMILFFIIHNALPLIFKVTNILDGGIL